MMCRERHGSVNRGPMNGPRPCQSRDSVEVWCLRWKCRVSRELPQCSQSVTTRLVTLFPCDSRAMRHACRRTALRGPLAATRIHVPHSRPASSCHSGRFPVWSCRAGCAGHVACGACVVSWMFPNARGTENVPWDREEETMEERCKDCILVTSFTISDSREPVHSSRWVKLRDP